MSTSGAPSSSTTWREILASSVLVSQRLQNSLSRPSLLILHRSQWRCLASSYSAVIQALILLLEHACSVLEPSEQEIMCRRLSGPLHALHQAVQEGETCLQESLPSSSNSAHSWLVERALKQGMSTDVVDLHLHHLLWTSSVVREQILRSAQIDGMELVISKQTKNLSEIWAHVDAQDDLLSAQALLKSIMDEEEGELHQLACFILQKLSCAENLGPITNSEDLPPFLWVDQEVLKRNPEILGLGGYGKVHEAIWLGGRFAVKDFFYVENNVVFGREATIQAQLRHPNVMPLVCCTKNPSLNKCSLVMELMQQDLRLLMMQRKEIGMDPPFPLLLALDLMLQIAKGMEYLHSDSLRIIHRDLKSSNILVSFSNRAGLNSSYANDVSPHVHLKVADFGMSKAKYASSRYTTRQTGTTPWRAPEVFEANPEDEVEDGHPNARYTNKADVYSFGLVCYEILTGKSPFEGTQIRRRVLGGERPRLPAQLPLALSSYIKRCWHAEPAERPTFSQICRMLRYFKACILLEDHYHDHDATEWLLHPLSTTMCARIDDMLQSLARQSSAILLPQLLVIPLEMYCCRVVLQQFRDETEVMISSQLHGENSTDVLSDEITAAGFYQGSGSTFQDQRSGVGLEELGQTAKRRYFSGTLKWLKKLSCMLANSGDTQHTANSELPDTLGLMGDFTYEELRIATNNFSSVIGRGASGKVFLGMLADGRRIAVKVANRWVQGASQQILTQELRIASQLQHRNIVPLFGWCQDGQSLLLVYEYMPNGDLGKHIFQEQESVIEWHQRYKVVCQLAAALKYLHQDSGYMQIVHRDVKTTTIMLDSEWNARLGNCGLADLVEDDSRVKGPAGNMGFLAPECAVEGTVSPASDIYSFGKTVLEIATGTSAFEISVGFRFLDEWVWELYEEGEVMQASDVRLRGNFHRGEMKRLLVLGLLCTNMDPQARPSIEEVIRILSTASEPPSPQARYRWCTQFWAHLSKY